MSVDKIIDDLYEILDGSWRLPFSGGKIIVDSKEIRCLLEDLRLKLPKELIQAKNIVKERSQVIENAKEEAERLMRVSEEKIKSMVNQSEIVKNAQLAANQIIAEAQLNSKEVTIAANQYVDNLMNEVDQAVTASLTELRKARQQLRSSDNYNKKS